MRCLTLLFLMLTLPLTAGVEHYFKRNPHDGKPHNMRNIDYIYMINLDRRPEKFLKSSKQLEPYGIIPFRFSAVNAWEDLTADIVNEVGVKFGPGMEGNFMGTSYLEKGPDFWKHPHHDKINIHNRTYFCHCMAVGPIAICLSHLSVLQDAWDAGFQTVWVMEDDIEVVRNPHDLSSKIDVLDRLTRRNWDILFTDIDTKSNNGHRVACTGFAKRPNFRPSNPYKAQIKVPFGKDFKRVGARYGAYSMIVRRSGMRKILDHFIKYKIFLPYDMDFLMPNDIVAYATTEDFVSTMINSLSDNGGPFYKKQ